MRRITVVIKKESIVNVAITVGVAVALVTIGMKTVSMVIMIAATTTTTTAATTTITAIATAARLDPKRTPSNPSPIYPRLRVSSQDHP